jgi:hypothetical protein
MNFDQIYEKLKESPSGRATGGLIGKTIADKCIQEEKPIIELLKLNSAEVLKNTRVIPEQRVIDPISGKAKYVKISDIKNNEQKRIAFSNWVNDAIENFEDAISKVRILSQQDKKDVRNYFQNLMDLQPLKGKTDQDGDTWY